MSALDDLAAFQRRMDAMPARRAELIRAAKAEGATWPVIAATLGMTVHGVRKAAVSVKPFGRPRSGSSATTGAPTS